MSREMLKVVEKCYDLGKELNLKEGAIDEFMEDCERKDIEGTWEDLSLILEKGIELKEKLGDIYSYCELNNWYENFHSKWDADEIGLRVYLSTGEEGNIIIELDSYEVCDQACVDETDEVYNGNELNLVIEHAKNLDKMISDWRGDDEDDYEEDED